jgi:hypothetical protein
VITELGLKDVPPEADLAALAARYVRSGGDPADMSAAVHRALSSDALPIPPALRKLARIAGLRLFVSTTIDTLIDRALSEVKEQDGCEVIGRSYALEPPVQDVLEVDWARRQRAVFRVFGEHGPEPERFALSEEDELEFLHRLQLDSRSPAFRHLFDALGQSHLLMLGCGLPDWIGRFLVRTLKNERLSRSEKMKAVADERVLQDSSFVVFLSGMRVQIYRDGNAIDFVDELTRRVEADPAFAPNAPARAAEPLVPPRSVFLSYAREDRVAVDALASALRDARIPYWLDRQDLRYGVDWRRTIHQAIASSAAVVACISKATERRDRGVYHEEWALACEEARRYKPSARFVWPVILGPLDTAAPREVPADFARLNYARALDGRPDQALVQELAEEIRRRQRGL